MTRDEIIAVLLKKWAHGYYLVIHRSDLLKLLNEYDRLVVENFGERLSNET